MERITQQFTVVRTIAISLVLIAAIFGTPLVGAQKTDGDSSSNDGSRSTIKTSKPSDDGGRGDTGGSSGGDTKPSSGGGSGDTQPSTTDAPTDSGDTKPTGGTVTTPDTAPQSTGTCPHGGAWNDIRDENGDCFDGGDPTVTNISVSNNRATVTVRNVGTQDYLVHLASYEAPLPHGHPDYIEAQTLFQSRTSNMVPGQQLTFSVPVPACGNYQVDLFTGDDVPAANPDFGAPPLSLTHTLFDWITEHEGEPCVPQCPQPAPMVITEGTVAGVVGQYFEHNIRILNVAHPAGVITDGMLPPGLTFGRVSGDIYRISGTPTAVGTNVFSVGGTNPCGEVTVPITIIITTGSCPIDPPVITSPTSVTGVVGQELRYEIEFSGIGRINVTNLPDWLTLEQPNVLVGTPSQPGAYDVNILVGNSCGQDEIVLRITVTGNQCPIDPPVITSPTEIRGAVGERLTYNIEFTGKGRINVTNLPEWLTWEQPNVLTGIPPKAGVYDVNILVGNSCGQDEVVLRIVVRDNQCPIDPPVITSQTQITGDVGEEIRYEIEFIGVGRIHVTNLPNWLELEQPNVLVGTPSQPGTYDVNILVGNSCGQHEIVLRIVVGGGGDDDDDDDGGGGGGRRRPNVVLFSDPEILGASISLSQVPYTGLGTSIVQIVLFILGLLAISGGIIYMVMRRFGRGGDASAHTPSTPIAPAPTPVGHDIGTDDESLPAVYEEYARSTVASSASVQPVAPQVPVYNHVPENIPVAPAAREVMRPVATMATTASQAPVVREDVSIARIQTEARSARALISDDGAELIAKSVEGDEAKALERMTQIIDIAKTRYPREDGWLILDKDRVREALFLSTLSMIPLFIEWIVRGEDKKVFTFLRMLKHQEQPVADFMRKVVSEFDTAHRARMEGGDAQTKVNTHVAEITYHLSNKDLESIIGELLHGVDERYDSAYTSVRLSLVRVLDVIKERVLRAAGAPYEFNK